MADSKRKWNSLLILAGAIVGAYAAVGAFIISLGGGWWAVALVPLVAIGFWLNQVFQPTGRRLTPRAFHVVLIGLAVLQVLTLVVPLMLVPKWMPAITLDGADPQRTGCAAIEDTIDRAEWPVVGTRSGAQLATALLKYSTACDTNWVKIEGVAPGTRTLTQVTRPGGDWLLPASPAPEGDAPTQGVAYSKQLRSNGCTYVHVTLLNGDDVIAELHEENGCG